MVELQGSTGTIKSNRRKGIHKDAKSISRSGGEFPKSIKIKLWTGVLHLKKYFLSSRNIVCSFGGLALNGNDN